MSRINCQRSEDHDGEGTVSGTRITVEHILEEMGGGEPSKNCWTATWVSRKSGLRSFDIRAFDHPAAKLD